MSNFSQYFPAASSGGGSGGTPINGYTPFLVTGTGNPSGYDATTGLYTHPDGTFWLKTGNTIVDNSSTYPSANGVVSIGSPVQYGFSDTGIGYINSSEVIIGTSNVYMSVGGIIYLVDLVTGNKLSTLVNTGDGRYGVEGYDETNGYIIAKFVDAPNNYRFYNTSGTLVSTGTGRSDLNRMTWISDDNYIIQGNSTGPAFYTLSTNTVGASTLGSGGAATSMTYDRTNDVYYSSPTGGSINKWVSLTDDSGNIGAVRATDYNNSSAVTYYDGAFYNFASRIALGAANGRMEKRSISVTVGDSTVRTSTDTAQPLFIRIK